MLSYYIIVHYVIYDIIIRQAASSTFCGRARSRRWGATRSATIMIHNSNNDDNDNNSDDTTTTTTNNNNNDDITTNHSNNANI